MIDRLTKNEFAWFPERGVGFYPVTCFPYDADYFNKYKGYAETELGKKITQARVAFVDKYFVGNLLDVGIGCGQFVLSRSNTFGYDVNPVAVQWLQDQGLYYGLYWNEQFEAVTFWDSLEHIERPEDAIKQAKKYVFVSIPIFTGLDDILNSRHYRKDEHYWYFTHSGLVDWFSSNGFDLKEREDFESKLGRDSVLTYAFKRRTND